MNPSSTPQLQRMEIRTLNLELNESFAISGGAVDVVELVHGPEAQLKIDEALDVLASAAKLSSGI